MFRIKKKVNETYVDKPVEYRQIACKLAMNYWQRDSSQTYLVIKNYYTCFSSKKPRGYNFPNVLFTWIILYKNCFINY